MPRHLVNKLRYGFRRIRAPANLHEAEILATLGFNPEDKVGLEYGKALVPVDPRQAVSVLEQVTRRLNADWRATYRAHHHLARAWDALGLPEKGDRHRALRDTCNPRWPGAQP